MGMFLRAINRLHERVGAKRHEETYKVSGDKRIRLRGGRKIIVGPGHIFYHPDEARARKLLAIGQGPNPGNRPVVTEPTEKQILVYINECLQGSYDPKTREVIRAPIALEALDKGVQEFWHDHKKKAEELKDRPSKPAGNKQAGPAEAAADESTTAAGPEDDENADAGHEPKAKPKAKAKPRKKPAGK